MPSECIYLSDSEIDWVHRQQDKREDASRSGIIRGAIQLQRALAEEEGPELAEAVAFYRNHLVASDEAHREAMRAYNQALAEEQDALTGDDVEDTLEATRGV